MPKIVVPAGARMVKIEPIVGAACPECGGPSRVDPETGGYALENGSTVCRDCGASTSHKKLPVVFWHADWRKRLAWKLFKRLPKEA